jgi:hypothetical protein
LHAIPLYEIGAVFFFFKGGGLMKANCLLRNSSAVLFVIFLSAFSAYPQTSRGTVSGTVLDSSGAVIFGSAVELTNPDTGVIRTTTSNNAGIYRFDAVDLGLYRIRISSQGFKSFHFEMFPVEANRTVTIDATLEPGGMQTLIEVTERTIETSLIKDAPLRGGNLSGDELVRLPGATTFPYNEATFPGTVFALFGSGQYGNNWDFSVNGSSPRGNNYMLDGTDNNHVVQGGAAQPFGIIDAIQESSAQTGNFGAEFGRAGGGVFNLITRSGSNRFHGTLSWKLLSQAFDSINNTLKLNTPAGQQPKNPVYTENIYGFTLGGPITKNKTFFFGGFQPDTRRSTSSPASIIPTEDAVAKLKTFFPDNPRLNLYLNALGSSRGAANPINIILGIDPIAGVDRGIVQFATTYFSLPAGKDEPQWVLRLDHNLSDIHRLSFRYLYDSPTNFNALFFFPGYYADLNYRNQNFLFSDSYTISPSWTNEFRFSYGRTGGGAFAGADTVPEAQTLPRLMIANVSAPGMSSMPQFTYANKWLFQETQTKLTGTHTFRYGFEFLRQLSTERGMFNDLGSLMYTNAVSPAYSAFANYLDDYSGPSGISSRVFGEPVFYPNLFRQSYFFQDAWKLKPSFTLTLGLRYENYGSPANVFKYPAFSGFDPSKFLEPNNVNTDNNNFGPSFGFAWSPHARSGLLGRLFGDGKTIWRGGFQVSYNAFFDSMLMNIQSDAPNSVATSFVASFSGRGTANFFSTLPIIPRTVTPLDQQTGVFDPNIRGPYTERWSFGFQRQLPQKLILDLAYVGSASHKLFTKEDVNVRQLNGTRVHPDFGIRQILANSGNSSYHGMQLRVERRFAATLSFTGSYTWSRNIDSTSEIVAGTSTGFAGSALTSMPISQGGLRLDRGLSNYHRSHVFFITFSWDIPGPKKGFWEYLAGGWSLVPSFWGSTGAPYTAMNGLDRNNDGNAADRPNIGNPDAPLNTRAVVSAGCSTGYLNPDTAGCVTPNDVHFIQGTGLPDSKTVGKNTLVAGAWFMSSATILKAFPLREIAKLEFRLEAANIFNNPVYPFIPSASVVGSPGPAGGRPSRFLNQDYTGNYPRTMNVQVKVIF